MRLQLAGDTAAARKLQRSSATALPAGASGSAHITFAYRLLADGDTTRAREELATAVAMSAHEYVREDAIAGMYFRLGDRERAIQWWERSVESNGAEVITLAKSPLYAPLRKDPRVQALLVKAGVK